jgi:hypothetical protein
VTIVPSYGGRRPVVLDKEIFLVTKLEVDPEPSGPFAVNEKVFEVVNIRYKDDIPIHEYYFDLWQWKIAVDVPQKP